MRSSTLDKSQSAKKPGPIQLRNKVISAKRLDKFILLQVAWCTFPALVLMRMGQFKASGIWCFLFLSIFLGIYALRRNSPAFVALTVASLPALMYTRAFFFHNSVLAFLGLGLIFWLVQAPKEMGRLWNNYLIRWFFISGSVYWIVSIALTGEYYANIRVMEMLCSAASIYLLAQYPKYLATGLVGLSVSLFSVAIGTIGHGDRLGHSEIAAERVGSNQSIGLPAALVLLLAIADNGQWLHLRHSSFIRNMLIAMCSILLLLSTSRGSWLVVLVGVGVAIFYQSQNRRKIFTALLLIICMLPFVLQTELGEKVSEYVERKFDPEKTLTQQTSGRFDMWLLFFNVLEDKPVGGVGPGLGKEAYAFYSWASKEKIFYREGSELAWHALYLQIGVETGMIGLFVLALLLGRLISKTLTYRKMTGLVMPLIGIVSYMTIGLSVPALEGLSGLFLGLAFIGTSLSKRKVFKQFHQPEPVPP